MLSGEVKSHGGTQYILDPSFWRFMASSVKTRMKRVLGLFPFSCLVQGLRGGKKRNRGPLKGPYFLWCCCVGQWGSYCLCSVTCFRVSETCYLLKVSAFPWRSTGCVTGQAKHCAGVGGILLTLKGSVAGLSVWAGCGVVLLRIPWMIWWIL